MNTLLGRRRVETFVGLAGAVGILAALGCGGSGGGGGSGSASTVAPSTSQTTGQLSLATGRALHTATVLKNGSIFVAGGVDSTGSALAETSIVTLTAVTSGPRLLQARVGCSVTVLENGKVLIAGGQNGVNATTALDSTELYDPLAGAVSAGPKMTAPRSEATAVSFGPAGSQLVLVAGGTSGSTKLNSAETYSVSANAFTALPSKLAEPVAGAQGAHLDDGTIVLVGGDTTTGAAGAEIFDPTTLSFAATNVTVRRSGAAFAANGRQELIAGGASTTGVEKTTETYDIATRLFSQSSPLNTARRDATASIVSAGVVVIGGRDSTSATKSIELLTGATLSTSTVSKTDVLKTARYGHTSTSLQGKILVIGGFDSTGTPTATIETIDPATIGATGTGGSVGLPRTGGTTVTPPPTTLPPAPGGSTSGGLGGLLGSLLGGLTGGSSSGIGGILGKVASAGIQTLLSQGFSGGIGGFLKGFAGNLLAQFFPPSSTLGGIIGAIFPPTTTSSSSTGGLSGILGSLLGGLTGGSSSSSGGGIGGVIGSLLGGLFGGGSSSTPPAPSGTAPTVLSMTPNAGPVGTAVVLNGTNLTGATVTFKKKQGIFSKIIGFITGGSSTTNATINTQTATTINLTVPSDADTGTVNVTVGGSSVSAGTFTVQ